MNFHPPPQMIQGQPVTHVRFASGQPHPQQQSPQNHNYHQQQHIITHHPYPHPPTPLPHNFPQQPQHISAAQGLKYQQPPQEIPRQAGITRTHQSSGSHGASNSGGQRVVLIQPPALNMETNTEKGSQYLQQHGPMSISNNQHS
jgi:hypothetical protein